MLHCEYARVDGSLLVVWACAYLQPECDVATSLHERVEFGTNDEC